MQPGAATAHISQRYPGCETCQGHSIWPIAQCLHPCAAAAAAAAAAVLPDAESIAAAAAPDRQHLGALLASCCGSPDKQVICAEGNALVHARQVTQLLVLLGLQSAQVMEANLNKQRARGGGGGGWIISASFD
jgi:hypothetical protein